MTKYLFLSLLCAGLAGCGDSTTYDLSTVRDMAKAQTQLDMTGQQGQPDLSMIPAMGDMAMSPMLTVNNTISWCTVIVTIAGVPTTFGSSSMTFSADAASTVMLQADPKPTFKPVVWTGVTTMNGDMATYVMTAAASQMVTACCPEPDGSGC